MEDIRAIISARLDDQKKLEQGLATLETELASNEQFKAFLEMQRAVKKITEDNNTFFEHLKDEMDSQGIKSIKGDWGSITLAERQGWDIDEMELPKKFFKKVVDTKKITDIYRLEGKAPKGAVPKITKYITKRLK